MANSLRSRPAKASYSRHSRSVTWLTAVRLSTLAPLASRKAASMSRVLSPRAYISTASCSSSAVRPARPVRTRETKVSARSATCGTPYSIAPSAVRSRAPPIAVAIPRPRRRSVLVVAAAHRLGDLGLQRLLDDLPDGELDQFAPRVALSDALGQQLVELLAVRSEAGILDSTGMPPLAAGANRRSWAWMPSKSASPVRFPASLGLHRAVAGRPAVRPGPRRAEALIPRSRILKELAQ